jgi:hypothetical protein
LLEALNREIAFTEAKLEQIVSLRELLTEVQDKPKRPKTKPPVVKSVVSAVKGEPSVEVVVEEAPEPEEPEQAEAQPDAEKKASTNGGKASRADQIRTLLSEGVKPSDIAQQLGIKVNYVYAVKAKM